MINFTGDNSKYKKGHFCGYDSLSIKYAKFLVDTPQFDHEVTADGRLVLVADSY